MRNVKYLIILLWAFLSQVSICDADIVHSPSITPYEDYQAYGATFESSGWVRLSRTSDPNDIVWASATKVSDNGIMYAVHTAELLLNGTYDRLDFGFGNNYYTNPGQIYTARNTVLDPSWDSIGQYGRDVALAFTDVMIQDIPSAMLFNGEIPLNADLYSAGYGMTGTPDSGATASYGDKLGTVNRISLNYVTSRPNYFRTEFVAPGSQHFREFGSQAFFGDSGKGWFININDEFYLASVLSTVSTNVGYGQRSTFSRIDFSWSSLEIYNNRLDSVPEPSSLLLLGTITTIFAARRRKRRLKKEVKRCHPFSRK